MVCKYIAKYKIHLNNEKKINLEITVHVISRHRIQHGSITETSNHIQYTRVASMFKFVGGIEIIDYSTPQKAVTEVIFVIISLTEPNFIPK